MKVVPAPSPCARSVRGRVIHRVTEVHEHDDSWRQEGEPKRLSASTTCHAAIIDATFVDESPEPPERLCLNCFHPEIAQKKSEARSLAARAIKEGLLKRQPCEECGNPKTDAHHDDYSKPLKVRWLCRRDHAAWHKAFSASFGEVAS